ncbi:MAG: spermidine synthase, partial [Planctomycetota bacterium]
MKRWLFGGAVFANAALVFVVQPLIAKALLPRFGGAPAVWSASVAFFQAALLLGYLWSHLLAQQPFRRQVGLHALLLILAAVFLPPHAPTVALGLGPVADLLAALALGVGLPFVAASATSPLLQSWFARTGADPYFLSSASNLGSLLGLLAYPLALEPTLPTSLLLRGWAVAFVVAALSSLASGISVRNAWPPVSSTEVESPPIPGARRLRWLALAAVPSCLLLAVTTHVASNVGAIPLLWVVPLALYLVTFAHAFARESRVPRALWSFLLVVLVVNAVTLEVLRVETILLLGPAHLAVFFAAAMACHVALANDRPPPAQLTGYWLTVSLGGVVGGIL